MQHVFVSDVHLGAFSKKTEKQIEQDLISLIDYCEKNHAQLHILGDLFDYWMEYPGYAPELGEELLERFEAYNRNNGGATFITGNHDNWTFGYFEEKGFNVSHDFADTTIGSQRVFMHHGDGFREGMFNLHRPFFHRLLRNKKFIKLYQSILPADAGIHLMKTFSSLVRNEDYLNPRRLDSWAESFLENYPYDIVLCGHDHIPRLETFSFGTYINLGTFFNHRSVAVYTNGEFDLVTWDGDAKQFKPVHSILHTPGK
ncbi:MAG: metallophosphoesterase [Balneolaceae bacterium]